MMGVYKFISVVLVLTCFNLTCTLKAQQKPDPHTNIPEGMILVKGSRVKIGSDEGPENERPSFQTYVNSFLIDIKPINVAEFRLFVRINRYITDAEKIGKAPVIDPESQSWKEVEGAYWEYPEGKHGRKAENNEPVRQISWNDAQAYAKWVGKRLPSEYELEFVSGQLNKYPVIDLNGSLWHWCENWYAPYDDYNYYSKQLNRQKTLKGGADLQSTGYPFRPSSRTSALPGSFSSMIGFRCAGDL